MTDLVSRTEQQNHANAQVALALVRTELALERTQLAWIRTVVGIYTAAFAADAGIQALHDAKILTGTDIVETGHLGGIVLALVGIAMSSATLYTFFQRYRFLATMSSDVSRGFSATTVLHLLVTALGVLLIAVMLFWG